MKYFWGLRCVTSNKPVDTDADLVQIQIRDPGVL